MVDNKELIMVYTTFSYRFFHCQRILKQGQTAKRKGKRKLRNPINPKQIKEKIAKNLIPHKQEMIFQRKFLPLWRNIKKYSLLLGCIVLKVQPV